VQNQEVEELYEQQKIEFHTIKDVSDLVDSDVEKINKELDKYKGKSQKLEAEVLAARKEISAKEKEIRRLIKENASLRKLKREVLKLRAINLKHLARIKDMEEELTGLKSDKTALMARTAELEEMIRELEEEKEELTEKVKLGSVLQAENITVVAEKRKSSGKYKEARLRKADRLLVVFQIDENKIAEPGSKTVFVRVIDGNGKLIESRSSGYFKNKDKNLLTPYTAEKKVNYQNKNEKVVVTVNLTGEVASGSLRVEVFSEGYFIGRGVVEVN
jgi:hypothetical protein